MKELERICPNLKTRKHRVDRSVKLVKLKREKKKI